MSEKYNGYTNYPTWNVKLWIDNEEGSYNYWHDAAREAEDAMGLVNWYEIAEMLIEDVKEG